MFLKVLAQELLVSFPSHLQEKKIRLLSYAPGPLDTNMQKEIRENPGVDPKTQQYFIELKEKGQLLSPAQSAEKLIAFLVRDEYENSVHVDYYDF
jgi:sepiapterin reductase